ncbi:unnamed protein product [Haemonchus placei]|uniref:Kinesin motor domain-containing protein n=1 Tax=Haemonchus placei TaxID=6290 RepID=A0A158QQ47_HAEPC|nr:unnamed protein product [Haemonchus placei]
MIQVKIELVGNRYNPQHKLILQATLINNADDWEKNGPNVISFVTQTKFFQNAAAAVRQLLNASNSKGADKVKELKDLISLLDADTKTILKNIDQTQKLKEVIEKQLAERATETAELRDKTEKLAAEEERLRVDLMREEAELRVYKERRGGNLENCVVM